MRLSRTRSLLATAAVLALAGVGWFFFAPSQIGGSTRYVITHGISMEPLIHTGDLVLVRPASEYHVGEVVAYRSTLLNTVVLHRIIRISDGHYTFKGDNNSFIDPTHPTRALLLGRMWLHIPHGGTVLDWVHKPWVAAMLTGAVAMMLLFGGGQQRNRRRRRHQQDRGPHHGRGAPSIVTSRFLLALSVIGALLFAALGVVALTRSSSDVGSSPVQYTQQLSFSYSGSTSPGSVYPDGTVSTGDPVYLQLVHQLTVTAAYKLESAAPVQLHGSMRIRGTLTNQTGWSRSFWLGPRTNLSGAGGTATALIDFTRLRALTDRVSNQIGDAGAVSYTLAVIPQVKLGGTVGGAPLTTRYSAPLDVAVGAEADISGQSAIQLSGSSAAGSSQSALDHSTPGSVSVASNATKNKLDGVPVRTVRLIALAGFVLCALLGLLTGMKVIRGPEDPVERINSRYKHLIVPVSTISTDPEHPPIEVRTIEALAQLAERSERLILHDHQDHADNYLIDDQGTLFRFQALRLGHTNGNGNGHRVAEPVAATVAVAQATGTGTATPTFAADPLTTASPEDPAPAAAVAAADPLGAAAPTTAEPAAGFVNGMAPLNDPAESAQSIRLSQRVTPDLPFESEPRRSPVRDYAHWSRRPEVRVGFTLGPLLTLLAWRQVRRRRDGGRSVEPHEQPFNQYDRRGRHGPQPSRDSWEPPRGPGDRRYGDRRRH